MTLKTFSISGLRYTLAVIIFLESVHFTLSHSAGRELAEAGLPGWFHTGLGITEALAAFLFLLPGAILAGGYLLLATFAAAIGLHLFLRDFEIGALLIYAMAALVCMAHYKTTRAGRRVLDSELIARFEDATLAGQDFHHAEHVRIAFLYLCRFPVLEALHKFSTALMNFAALMGKPDRYNETITWAFLFLIRDRMARAGNHQSWSEFAADNQDLLNWQDHPLKKYYSTETLVSDLARTTFLFPDKAAPSPDRTQPR